MNEVALTIAFSDYDHVREIAMGRIATPGMRLTFLDLEIPEINGRFATYREWHISEMGLGKYVALRAQGDDGMIAIPVFPSRLFRHSAIYVADDSPLTEPAQLAGRRIGIPEWAQTAVVYARGFLVDDYGLDLASAEWMQAGLAEPGRREKMRLSLPSGVSLTPRPEATLQGMLLAGEIDALISAMPPPAFVERAGIRRLLADPQPLEEDYFRRTGIFPIMHVVALRRDVYEAHPWVAGNLMRVFEQAKHRAMARLLDSTTCAYPLPFSLYAAERARQLLGEDFYPYGLERNRATLAAFLRYAHQQGVAERLLEPFGAVVHAREQMAVQVDGGHAGAPTR